MKINYESCKLFQNLDEDVLLFIDNLAQVVNYHKGKIIHLEEDICENLEIIISGNINIEQIKEEGYSKIVTSYGKGSCIGLNILFSSEPIHLMNGIASEDTTVFRLNKDVVSKLIDDNEKFRWAFINLLSDNSKKLGLLMKEGFRVSLRQKIIQYINHQSKIQAKKRINIHTTKTNLARMFGVERTSLSRELQKMKKDKIIDYDRYSIELIKENINGSY